MTARLENKSRLSHDAFILCCHHHNQLAMAVTLPNEILHLICVELVHQHDFNSLFNVALSSKQLAQSALPNLYRWVNNPQRI
jgi:hypothetical protein